MRKHKQSSLRVTISTNNIFILGLLEKTPFEGRSSLHSWNDYRNSNAADDNFSNWLIAKMTHRYVDSETGVIHLLTNLWKCSRRRNFAIVWNSKIMQILGFLFHFLVKTELRLYLCQLDFGNEVKYWESLHFIFCRLLTKVRVINLSRISNFSEQRNFYSSQNVLCKRLSLQND